MQTLQNAKVCTRSPLIVTADALTATQAKSEYRPSGTHCLFEGRPHVIVAGLSRGANFPAIQVGEQMIMQLRRA